MTTHELVIFTRTFGCAYVSIARSVLNRLEVEFREINIDDSPEARKRLQNWVGFLSVPTLIITEAGQEAPYTDPEPLPTGQSPRGVDRGSIITEPNADQLSEWLKKNGFVPA